MFLIFLIGYIFWTPWYEQCQKQDSYAYTLLAAEANSIANNLSVNTDESVDDTASDAALVNYQYHVRMEYVFNSINLSEGVSNLMYSCFRVHRRLFLSIMTRQVLETRVMTPPISVL